ncbi:MAG TPA: cell division protein FtsL [Candidatus Acidoferrum sp.]|nr:cell division protein FtsL [Candidatus Acidoferrum sp.]
MHQAIGTAGVGIPVASRPLPRRRWAWWEWLESISAWGLGILVLAGALFYVWQHTRVVRLGYEIERLLETKAALQQEHKSLRLEMGQLRSLRRVEEIARTRLGMVTPKPGQIVLIPEAPIQ